MGACGCKFGNNVAVEDEKTEEVVVTDDSNKKVISTNIMQGPRFKQKPDIKTLGQFFFDQADRHASRMCMIDLCTAFEDTFHAVKTKSVRMAIEMRKAGVRRGDKILVCSTSSPGALYAFVASQFLGVVVANLDPSLSVRDTKHLLDTVKPMMIFVLSTSIGLIEESYDGSFETQIVSLGDPKCSGRYPSIFKFLIPSTEEDAFRPVAVDVDDTAAIFFSSGTTGLPKATCVSHSALLYNAHALLSIGFRADAMLHFTSFYWMSAVFMLIASFIKGGFRVTAANYPPNLVFDIIQKYKITAIMASSNFTYTLTNFTEAEDYDTSSLDCMIVGGSPLSPRQLLRTRALFKHAKVVMAYGMTECGFVSCFDATLPIREDKAGSSGRLLPEVALKIVDPSTRRALRQGEKGEICVRTNSLMNGYHTNDATASTTGDEFDEEGFLRTGDVGYVDSEGYLYVIDRLKEMFKYKSWHVVPSSLEAVLLEHDQVGEAMVFGVPHEEDGHLPAAAVVLKEGARPVGVEELQEFMAARVLDRERLRGGVFVLDELAKTPTGKVMRNMVKDTILRSIFH